MTSWPRRRPAEPGTPLSELLSTGRDGLDAGQLVRALARSVVHVPLPGAPAEPQPRVVSSRSTGEAGPPLWVVEDGDGRHALVFSTAARLVAAFGDGTGGATLPFASLAAAWPEGVDLVLDAGSPDALEVPLPVLRHVLLEIAGVPTATALLPAPGDRSRRPQPEPVQLLGATREAAAGLPEVRALSRAETLADVPSPRPVLDVLVDLDPVDDARLEQVMAALAQAATAVEPRPLRLTACVDGAARTHPELADAVRGVDEPYYRRDA